MTIKLECNEDLIQEPQRIAGRFAGERLAHLHPRNPSETQNAGLPCSKSMDPGKPDGRVNSVSPLLPAHLAGIEYPESAVLLLLFGTGVSAISCWLIAWLAT